jgi:hypothetical protein
MKRMIPLLLAFLMFFQAIPSASAEEPPEPNWELFAADFGYFIDSAFYGGPNPGILRSTLVYLIPEEALKVNRLIIENYASDPNTTYQNFLPYQEQVLYWYYGRYFIKPQLVSDVLLYRDLMLRHPIFYALGFRSVLTDKVGAYSEMYAFVENTLHPFEQF